MYISKELKKHENKKFGEGSENDWILVSPGEICSYGQAY